MLTKNSKKKWEISDLYPRDYDLLIAAASMPAKSMFCFGPSYGKLYQLGLISDDTRITLPGVKVAQAYINAQAKQV